MLVQLKHTLKGPGFFFKEGSVFPVVKSTSVGYVVEADRMGRPYHHQLFDWDVRAVDRNPFNIYNVEWKLLK